MSDHSAAGGGTAPSAWLVECARDAFARCGYHGTDLLAVARSAGISVERVRAAFGSKEAMYLAVMYEPLLPSRLPVGEQPALGERVLHHFLESRKLGRNDEVALSLICASHIREGAAAAVRLLYEGILIEPLSDAGECIDLRPRIAVTTAVLLGITLALDVIHVQPLACADDETLIEWLAPVVDRAARGGTG
jgi:AcrR family transcriptional regulator